MDLKEKFKELSKVVIDELEIRKIDGINSNIKTHNVYVPNLAKLCYKNGKVNYNLEKSELKKPIIDFESAVPKFYDDFCVKLPEFQELLKLLEDNYQLKKEQGEIVIRNLIIYIIYKINQNEKDSNKIVDKYIKKLNFITPYAKTKIFIDGIWITTEKLRINENLKIRRIKPSDFESHSPEILEQEFPPFGNFAYSILIYNIPLNFEFKSSFDLQKKILKKIRTLVNAFLLLRYGSIFSRKCIMPIFQPTHPEVIMQGVTGFGYSKLMVDFTYGQMVQTNPHLHIKTRHNYIISEKDIPNINEILEVFDKEEIRKILFPKPKKTNYIYIALNRYQNAFLNVENSESQISYAISCLEALLSMRGTDLKRTLSQRISLIFRILGFNPLSIGKIVREAYDVRSGYSHGDLVKYEDKERLAVQILQCARISLLIILQVDTLISKKEIIVQLHPNKNFKKKKVREIKGDRKNLFLKIIDYALLDKIIFKKLQGFFLENVKLFP